MYDTLRLVKEGASYKKFVPSLLSNCKEHITEVNQYFSGAVGTGQKVFVFDDKVMFEGSISKYYLRDNIKSITRSDTQRAIEHLSDALKVDFRSSEVKRIDVGLSIDMQYPPNAYYSLLGASERYARNTYRGSLYYKVGQREKIFYNKLADAKAKGMFIPEFLAYKNLLRYELRYKKKLDKQFNKAEIVASDLFNEDFYMNLLDNWYNEYLNIKKMATSQINPNEIKTPSDFTNHILKSAILASGIDIVEHLEQQMNQAKAIGVFESKDRKYYTRTKAMVNKMLSSGIQSELIQEMDKKFKNQLQFYR
jgi:hypothetical protein